MSEQSADGWGDVIGRVPQDAFDRGIKCAMSAPFAPEVLVMIVDGEECYHKDTISHAIAFCHGWEQAPSARDAELAALRRQVDALKASREAWKETACAVMDGDFVTRPLQKVETTDAACRAAGVEVEG